MFKTTHKKRSRKRKPETKQEVNLVDLIEQFGSEKRCREYLEELRWPDGVVCPRCGCNSVSHIHDRHQYDCNSCRYQFSVKSGTIMHDSHLPLWKWFLAVYMMIESKKGVSANQVKRTIGVSYKTAWYLCHRIREAVEKATHWTLDDIVEADETFIGGKTRGKGHGYKGNKAIAAVAVERGGPARMGVIPDRTRKSLHRFLDRHVSDSARAIYTDEWEAYRGIADKTTAHKTVNHGAEEWARGEVHTNTAESVWALLERSIMGAYHHVSHKHLDRYLDELEWRFGNRDNPKLFRDTIICMIRSDNLEYKSLIASQH